MIVLRIQDYCLTLFLSLELPKILQVLIFRTFHIFVAFLYWSKFCTMLLLMSVSFDVSSFVAVVIALVSFSFNLFILFRNNLSWVMFPRWFSSKLLD
ncbi:hypothetical protein BDC45DRAFT_498135, partial [Circinella umbellata]